MTALGGLKALGPLVGRTLLIEGAAGGVGSAAVEIARALGATVIGTASERNHAYLTSLGAIPVTYGAGLSERLAGLAPNGIDLALDAAASGSLSDLVEIAGVPDRVVTVADHINAAPLGVRVANAVNDPTLLAEAARLGKEGRYVPRIEMLYPLEEIAKAHAASENGHVRGKIVVTL